MRKTVLLVGCLIGFAASIASGQTPRPDIGQLRQHELTFGEKKRAIRVWLPPGYDASGDRRYPVLYLHDGQNIFGSPTAPYGGWKVNQTLTELAKAGTVDVPIVVGIDNGGETRIDELTYTRDPQLNKGGNGAQYEYFITATVLPFVEETYRVRVDRDGRIIGGSSLGGTMSLELAMRHPDRFGKVLAMSPSLWWDRLSIPRSFAENPATLRETRVYVDIGQREGPVGPARAQYVAIGNQFDGLLTAGGAAHQFVIDPAGEHNEPAWARRFPAAIQYLLPPKPPETATTSSATTRPD